MGGEAYALDGWMEGRRAVPRTRRGDRVRLQLDGRGADEGGAELVGLLPAGRGPAGGGGGDGRALPGERAPFSYHIKGEGPPVKVSGTAFLSHVFGIIKDKKFNFFFILSAVLNPFFFLKILGFL
jgi:hypothetical protein